MMKSWKARLGLLPPGSPDGYVLNDYGELVKEGLMSEWCRKRLRDMARIGGLYNVDDPPIVTADILAKGRRGKRKMN
jgi:hypothetical protein